MADAASLAALSIEVWVGTYLRQGASSFFAELVLSEFTAARIEAIVDGGIDFLIFSENLDPKFSSWSLISASFGQCFHVISIR